MAFELSFAPEFFIAPHDLDGVPPEDPERPISVYQAIKAMSKEEWAAVAKEVFECDLEHLSVETVMDRIVENNTCRNLTNPVEVFIDYYRLHSVFVYNSRG